ncbi:hypothetical protein SKAU_G00383530 [Synaphobranchus kaupii]|uniref:Uncharacterized protein n=1 Tax=Synaphobranchus kaupii TaxID=118154 RepID=A0A9Q1EE57_SYNKA|nr:hypothetical protein SKAU_G00383530 [Synaphobranchus kaupii]
MEISHRDGPKKPDAESPERSTFQAPGAGGVSSRRDARFARLIFSRDLLPRGGKKSARSSSAPASSPSRTLHRHRELRKPH